jgi:hypothetical protein
MANAQFLILMVPDPVKSGSMLRLLGTAKSDADAQQRLQNLDSSVTGRVAIVEVKSVYDRRPAIQNIPVEDPSINIGE